MDTVATLFPFVFLAQANQTQTLQANIVFGICFHLLVARPKVEFERFMRRFITVAGVVSGGDLLLSVSVIDRSLLAAIIRLCISWSAFLLGLLISLTLYRLLLHRCRIFPGPATARLTRLHASYLNAQPGQFYEKLAAMHEKYGDFVRVGE
jgi:hypothetical protein